MQAANAPSSVRERAQFAGVGHATPLLERVNQLRTGECPGRALAGQQLLDTPYYVAPDARAAKAYALLVQALEKTGLVAVARIVLSTKQHLCILRGVDGRLVLTTLVWADEVRQAPEVGKVASNPSELKMAEQLVRSMTAPFNPKSFRDDHRARVEKLLEKKASGESIEVPPESRVSRVVDLAQALQRSLTAASRSARRPGRALPARARRRAPPARARARRR
jgi:DNA end-binding protein Ku